MNRTATRVIGVLRQFPGKKGARKLTVLSGLAQGKADFERAIGQLFILGVVRWYGKKQGRRLGTL